MYWILVLGLALFGQEGFALDRATPLTLIRALPVDGPEDNQPSGLALFEDTLYAVSDKHGDTIYRIELMEDRAVFVPHLRFDALPLDPPVRRLDFEGITHDEEGNFYLVSETAFRILRVPADGGGAQWITPILRPSGEAAGLFQTRGANLEGVMRLGPGAFLVCAERQPRGLIEVNLHTDPPTIRAFNYDQTRLAFPAGRAPTFSGLFREGEDLYVVERNAEAIVRFGYGGEHLVEREVWSYGHIANRPDLRYSDMRYGVGEGLCMDRERVYLILDNNGDYRASMPEDRRPLLLIMKRPAKGD